MKKSPEKLPREHAEQIHMGWVGWYSVKHQQPRGNGKIIVRKLFSTWNSFLFIHLKAVMRERERERERGRTLQLIHSQNGHNGQGWNSVLVLCMCGADPSTWAMFCVVA